MKHQLDLPVLLPDTPGAHDLCVDRLVSSLSARPGVLRVHVVDGEEGEPARVCVHHDRELISISEIEALARQVGAALTDRYAHHLWQASGRQAGDLVDPRRARALIAQVERIPGVEEASATAAGMLRLAFDRQQIDAATVRAKLAAIGLLELEADRDDADHDEADHGDAGHEHGADHDEAGHEHGAESNELIVALASGAALGAGFLLDTLTELPAIVPLIFYVGSCVLGGWFTTQDALRSLRARRFEIDFLMLVAAAGAGALGEWAEGGLLLFLFSLGHALEHFAMGKARRAIEALADLAPKTARVRRDGEEHEIEVGALRIGDRVLVKPDERLAADGFVVQGTTSIDESPITGESVPADKRPVDDLDEATARPQRVPKDRRVFAGTINGSAAIEIQVTELAGDSTLARVVKMVSEAETQRSPTQRLTDRFERIFVPAVLSLVVLLLFAWAVIDEPFAASFYRAMAVLVAASPCALAIATPSAVLSAVACAGRGGVLIKGGGPLEQLGAINAIAFDKTGTLTEGRPQITDLIAATEGGEDELLRTAVAVERLSDHPLAAAVVQAGRAQLGGSTPLVATELRSLTGYGVEAQIDGEAVHIGQAALFEDRLQIPLPPAIAEVVGDLQRQGRTTMIVRRGDRFLGVLALMDAPRASAAAVIVRLRALGIHRMVMLSGDHDAVAQAVGREVGIDDARGGLLPQDKVEAIRQIREALGAVAMVGDGVNDAPAMAHATVSVAMGAAGSDVALETADVALMGDDLGQLPFVIGLSRKTSRIIKQNLWLSLGVVALLVPATVLGLGIGPAVALHEGSTLVVVFNALRLLGYRAEA